MHAITPKLPKVGLCPELETSTTNWHRTFGQLTLIQYLLEQLGLGRSELLIKAVQSFPDIARMQIDVIGVQGDWPVDSPLWR